MKLTSWNQIHEQLTDLQALTIGLRHDLNEMEQGDIHRRVRLQEDLQEAERALRRCILTSIVLVTDELQDKGTGHE